jgi:phenylacetate-CoA ligase
MDVERYWNPIAETLPAEKLEELQLKKFQNIVEWAYEHSKFHHKLYSDAGLEPGDVKTFDDIRKVPKMEKSMMRLAQGKDPHPYGDVLSVPLEEVTEYHQTSGTTGQPVYQADTWQDWAWYTECWAYALYASGHRRHDRAFIAFGYNIFIAFWGAHYALERIGCEVIPGGLLDTVARIYKVQELRATALVATPTYALSMAETAKRKLNIDPAKDLQVRKVTVAGEPGGSIPATKARIERAWGAKVYDQVGTAEAGPWGFECEAQCGLHVIDSLFLAELENIETGEIITVPGRRGKLLVTAFDRMAQPCIRFNTNDIAEWSPLEKCECGRTFRLTKGGILGRADDITKVKGVLLAPASIEEVVRSFPELSNEYEVIVIKRGYADDITLKVELLPEWKRESSAVKEKLAQQLRIKTNLGFNVEFHDYGSLPRYETKARRFKDLRRK